LPGPNRPGGRRADPAGVALTGWTDRVRKRRWRAALSDRRLLGLLGTAVVLSLALFATPLAGRAWLLLGWSVLVYLVAAVTWAWRSAPTTAPVESAPPHESSAPELS